VQRSANEVMQEVIVSAVIDAMTALRAASGGLPNNLLREFGAVHANATFADLPKEMQIAIQNSVRAAFTRLLKEGYNVGSASAPMRPPSQHQVPDGRASRRHPGERRPGDDRPRGKPGGRSPGGRPSGPGGGKPPRGPRSG